MYPQPEERDSSCGIYYSGGSVIYYSVGSGICYPVGSGICYSVGTARYSKAGRRMQRHPRSGLTTPRGGVSVPVVCGRLPFYSSLDELDVVPDI